MGTYNIPRNTKGEGRLLLIFSKKAILWTVGGIFLGAVIRYILKFIGSMVKATAAFNAVGIIFMAIFGVLGFVIGTFKMPRLEKFEITKKAGGIPLDKVLIESIKFKLNRVKVYVYDSDELSKEEIEHELDEREKNEKKEEKIRAEQIEKASKNRRGYIR